ncbi:receptor expression-enhancing protein 2-like isoform X2 [Pristis pectinata]|uniref:receptor expression-enhancing protein 2-like isoform X2 n=1 Tax=Pristis pectinata TaxID=685728 RepID=UPI00223DAAF4|nr:receptor expression-enhancing protein 2-like isoform X2 [Pristis pectinata]
MMLSSMDSTLSLDFGNPRQFDGLLPGRRSCAGELPVKSNRAGRTFSRYHVFGWKIFLLRQRRLGTSSRPIKSKGNKQPRTERLIFGTLYPAYSSYKAVKTKNVKEYVKWMMYWIVFAFFTTAETLTDIILSWFPFYFELKIAFVIWLLSPYTKGSSVLYRKFVHPTLSSKEKEIDEYISQAKDRSYQTMMRFGKRGLNLAANAAVTAAAKGQGVLSDKLRSFSMQDLTLLRDEDSIHLRSTDPHMRMSTSNILETISDSGEELGSAQAQKSDGEQPDVKLEQADEDIVDKVPKRTQSLKASKQKLQRSEPQSKSVKLRAKKRATSTTSSPESA